MDKIIEIELWRVVCFTILGFLLGLLVMGLFFEVDNASVYEKLYRGEYKLKVEEINIVGQDTSYVVDIKRVDK
jgi:hypothetical protein